jgi:ribonucleoside-diphosphate reductase alpha chain
LPLHHQGLPTEQHVAKLPLITKPTAHAKIFVVPDTIEGWADALDALMSSYFEESAKYPEYRGHRIYFDLTKIRPKGSKISGGFKAPGPDALRLALDRIEHILQGATLSKKKANLKPIQVYDIIMHAADAVISGGVRRSATICLFSHDDESCLLLLQRVQEFEFLLFLKQVMREWHYPQQKSSRVKSH